MLNPKKYLKGVGDNSISVVIPAYNEESTIETVIKDAISYLKKITNDYEVVIVNDGSQDKTGNIINHLAAKNKKVRAIHHQKNKGFTGAYKSCFNSAKKNLVLLAPADGQFEFSQLKNFTEAIRGYDVAIGYRVENEETLRRKLISILFHFLCRLLFGITLKEISTVSMWKKNVIESIDIISDDRSAMFLPEIISKAMKSKYTFIEVPIHWYLRKGGQAKGASPKEIVKTLHEMLNFWYLLNVFPKKSTS